MEVQTKKQITEIIVRLTPRDFSSLTALIDLGERWANLCADMIPEEVKVAHAEWCKEQIAKQRKTSCQTISFGKKEETNCPQEEDDGAIQVHDKSKYYNVVFQHISWEHSQQLLTLAKQLNIEFGYVKPE